MPLFISQNREKRKKEIDESCRTAYNETDLERNGSVEHMRIATAEQMRTLDRRAIEERGVPSLELMERELALRLTARWPGVVLWPASDLPDYIARS